jgi:hypothetical protein
MEAVTRARVDDDLSVLVVLVNVELVASIWRRVSITGDTMVLHHFGVGFSASSRFGEDYGSARGQKPYC